MVFPTLTQLFLNQPLLAVHFLQVRKLAELQELRESRLNRRMGSLPVLPALPAQSQVLLQAAHLVVKPPFHRTRFQANRQLVEATVHREDWKNRRWEPSQQPRFQS